MTIVTGLGGSGKSVFLKYTFLHCARMNISLIPVYIELRDAKTGITLEDLIKKEINIKGNIDDIGFHHALSGGRFIFLFDAYDEIDEDNRDDVGREIKELAYKYDNNVFFVSSRPSDDFKNWYEFQVSEILSFTKKQVISLVHRIKYEPGAKNRFINAIQRRLFETHSAYLSNPLLCIIMLMTFDQGAGIPEKQHLFFDLAFDVLFYKHDATKGGHYRRLFLTQLSIDRFKAAFGSFCAFSYIGKGSSFMRGDALDFAGQALSYDKLQKEPEHLVSDITKRMCLLIKEGSRYSFIHRTFQECFTAYFLSQRSFEGWDAVVHQIVLEKPNDNVIPMLRDMDPSRFNEFYLKPRLDSFLKEILGIGKEVNPQDFCKLIFTGFGLKNKEPYEIEWYTVGDRQTSSHYHYMTRLIGTRAPFELETDNRWNDFLSLQPAGLDSEEEDGITAYSFNDLTVEQAKLTSIYAYVNHLETACKKRIAEINSDLENKKRLVASSILGKLAGMRTTYWVGDETSADLDDVDDAQ